MSAKLSTIELLSLDSARLQKRLNSGQLTSIELVQACLAQIDKHDQRGAKLNAMVSVVAEQALIERSAQLDRERAAGRVRSPFNGIPILVKDAIATGPSFELATTLADANSNGWSAAGGQTQFAYLARKPNETGFGQSDPCGSSTGSAVCVSAGYAPLAIGTESIGSIVMPGTRAGLYAFKPALQAVNMEGVFKSSMELDVVGGLARSTADLARLGQIALTDEKRNLLPPEGYQKYLTKTFESLRIGFLDPTKRSLHPDIVQLDELILKQMNQMYFEAVARITRHATDAFVAYPVDIPPAKELWYERRNPIGVVMSYEGKQAMEDWLDMVKAPGLNTIEDIIKFNSDHPQEELPEGHADQNQLLKATRDPPSQATYEAVKKRMNAVSKVNGIDKLFREQNLNLLAFPMDSLMAFISAASGTI